MAPGTEVDLGPNAGQVRWILRSLAQLPVPEWRRLADAVQEEAAQARIDDTIVEARERAGARLVDDVRKLAVELAEEATLASQKERGELLYNEVPITASGWTGELEGTRREYLAPQDRFPFRQAARNVVTLVALRPYVSTPVFAELWAPYEAVIGLIVAEQAGLVVACLEVGR